MNITLIGYGEFGRIRAEDLRAGGAAVCAWDSKLATEDSHALRQHAAAHGVVLAAGPGPAVHGAGLVVSAVTASQAVAVARDVAAALPQGAFFLDLNSASPGAKIGAAGLVDAAGGRYVEGAVMTSVPPYRLQVPLLLGGPHATALQPLLQSLGFAPRVHSDRLGVASATKMCRSVMIKGLEAMVIESFTTARHYGVEDAVIASLHETFPGIDWEKQAAYFFQRVIEHGRRRSEEMREAAVTVREAGLEPFSAAGTAERQAHIADLAELADRADRAALPDLADLADAGVFGARGAPGFARSADWRTEADRILARAAADRPPTTQPQEVS